MILGRSIEDRPLSPVESYQVLEDDSFTDFIDSLKRYSESYLRVERAAANLRYGKFGKWRNVGEGVREIKIDFGEGFRIYYAHFGRHIILLVGAGGKSDQGADIQKAIKRWKEIKSGVKKYQ